MPGPISFRAFLVARRIVREGEGVASASKLDFVRVTWVANNHSAKVSSQNTHKFG